MGCIYEDSAKEFKKNRTPEQKKVINYFRPLGGCVGGVISLFSRMSDDQYEAMIAERVKQINSMDAALNKLGIDVDMVKEVKPIYFEGYHFDEKKTFARLGKDDKWRSSAYEITWIFAGDKQLYVYNYRFNMDEDSKTVTAEEFFYKDITNVNHTTETVEKEIYDFSCIKSKKGRKSVEYNDFVLSAMGDKLLCSMHATEENERSIQGLKNKIREKKNA
ncbi:MAG: hypothetical protein J6I49_00555 [Bacteroidales bacterium]|nr:hypothetical protein [Bacteroidales bacterium]